MKAIIAVNNLNYIGLNGKIPWQSADDYKHFRELTTGCTLLVGYNTAISLPKLNNRTIIIDNENIDLEKIDWCIGGTKTFEKYCYLFTELHVSHIDDDTVGDILFPNLEKLNPDCKIYNYNFKTK